MVRHDIFDVLLLELEVENSQRSQHLKRLNFYSNSYYCEFHTITQVAYVLLPGLILYIPRALFFKMQTVSLCKKKYNE